MKTKILILLSVAFLPVIMANAQVVSGTQEKKYFFLTTDSLEFAEVVNLNPVYILSCPFVAVDSQKAFARARYYVLSVLGYYHQALDLMDELDGMMGDEEKRRVQRKIIRKKQRELEDVFGNELKNLSRNQGKTLLTMLERKTGKSFFDLIKHYRGGTSASKWNALGWVNSYRIKEGFSLKKDYYIDYVMRQIEGGQK